jgi:hypothetical protein
VIYQVRLAIVFFCILLLLSSCFQPQPNQQPTPPSPETPLFTDQDIDHAKVDTGQEESLEGIEANAVPQGEASPLISEPINAGDLSTQAVLAGAKGFVVYIWNNPADTIRPWRIYRHSEITNATTLVYGGLRQLESVSISGDGLTLLVSMKETTDPASDYEIYQIVVSPQTVTQLTINTGADTNVSMSGGGSFYVWEGDATTAGIRNVLIRNNTVSPARINRISSATHQIQPSMSNDGNYISLVRRTATNSYQIMLYNRLANNYQSVYTSANLLEHPSPSDGGVKIAWLQHNNPNKVIYTKNIQSNGESSKIRMTKYRSRD